MGVCSSNLHWVCQTPHGGPYSNLISLLNGNMDKVILCGKRAGGKDPVVSALKGLSFL